MEDGLEGENTGENETNGETLAEVYVTQDGSLYLTSDGILKACAFRHCNYLLLHLTRLF